MPRRATLYQDSPSSQYLRVIFKTRSKYSFGNQEPQMLGYLDPLGTAPYSTCKVPASYVYTVCYSEYRAFQ